MALHCPERQRNFVTYLLTYFLLEVHPTYLALVYCPLVKGGGHAQLLRGQRMPSPEPIGQ